MEAVKAPSLENRKASQRAKLNEIKFKATQICAQVVTEIWETHLRFLKSIERFEEKFDEGKMIKEFEKFFIEVKGVGKVLDVDRARKCRNGLGLVLKCVGKEVGLGLMLESGFYVDEGKVGRHYFCATENDQFIVVCMRDLVS